MENSVFHINNYILDCLYLVPFCAFWVGLLWCSQDSILQLLGTKVSNFWENIHMNIWTFTVPNGNLLGESHERILENEIFYILYGTLFLHFALLFHPSNRGLQILHESDVFLPFFYFSSKHDHLCYMLFLLFYLSILSSDLSFSITRIVPLFYNNLFWWGFLDWFHFSLSSSLINEVPQAPACRN